MMFGKQVLSKAAHAETASKRWRSFVVDFSRIVDRLRDFLPQEFPVPLSHSRTGLSQRSCFGRVNTTWNSDSAACR
jgi:hypothetical protein